MSCDRHGRVTSFSRIARVCRDDFSSDLEPASLRDRQRVSCLVSDDADDVAGAIAFASRGVTATDIA
ncbi:MAG: hypothetical protein QOF83_4317 [Solirubrobacteraceae bacterium]|jgi:hypothetical protein|nr:hypothetical protein [Solirubrobacteraceae bacterium]